VKPTATRSPPARHEGDAGLTLRFWAALLSTALALRLVFSLVLVAGWPLVSDGSAYSEQAKAFTHHFGGTEPYYWPPGTSYVLAVAYEVFGSGRTVARLAMIVISLLSVVATVFLARRVLTDTRGVRLAGWILAVQPSAVFMPSQPFSFDITMLCLTVTVLAVLMAWDRGQARWLAGAGLALGFAATARPGVVSVLVAMIPFGIVAARRSWLAGERARVRGLALGAAAFAVCAIAAVVPALVHNNSVGAGVTISTNNEGNLLLGNNPYTHNYKTWAQGQHPFSEFPPEERAFLEEHITLGGSPERRTEMRDEAIDYMLSNPGITAWRTLNRARAFWGFDYTYSNGLRVGWDAPAPAVAAAAALEIGGWLVLGALVLAGLLLGRGLFLPHRALFLLLVVVAYELPHLIAFSAGRWHLPVLGLLSPFAAAGAVALRSPREAIPVALRSRSLLLALMVFGVIQVEYAYFVLSQT
jgi:4-amino-4-deoxy-L-arabinose transferase-like glycosyltransferase